MIVPYVAQPVSFRLDDDGVHFWFAHDCDYNNFDGTPRHATMLPINDQTGWKVVSTDPLTVTPSILCGSCGCHGFITKGKWVGV